VRHRPLDRHRLRRRQQPRRRVREADRLSHRRKRQDRRGPWEGGCEELPEGAVGETVSVTRRRGGRGEASSASPRLRVRPVTAPCNLSPARPFAHGERDVMKRVAGAKRRPCNSRKRRRRKWHGKQANNTRAVSAERMNDRSFLECVMPDTHSRDAGHSLPFLYQDCVIMPEILL